MASSSPMSRSGSDSDSDSGLLGSWSGLMPSRSEAGAESDKFEVESLSLSSRTARTSEVRAFFLCSR